MDQLESFLRAAKSQGASDEFLVALFKQQGWPEKAVYQALGRFYAEATGQTLPAPKSTLESAREAFYHLLAFGTLATWIFAIGSIWFELIDTWLPDPAVAYYRPWALRNVSWQIAAILVSFPVFVLATRSILADMALSPEKAASGVRRWLTNIALLVAALIFIGDLVTFLAVFLQGDLTSRFIAKSFVVLFLSGGVFLYYTRGLGNNEHAPARSWHRAFALTAAAAILVTIVFGFMKTGSPQTQRLLAEDRTRTRDLSDIANAIHRNYTATNAASALPASLAELNDNSPLRTLRIKDPITGQAYEYTPGPDGKFQLCATFNQPSVQMPPGADDAWSHPAGRHCFALNARLTYYVPFN
jgi:hypothetical protein